MYKKIIAELNTKISSTEEVLEFLTKYKDLIDTYNKVELLPGKSISIDSILFKIFTQPSRVKGQLPKEKYDFHFFEAWFNNEPANSLETALDLIKNEFRKAQKDIFIEPWTKELTFKAAYPTINKIIGIFFPFVEKNEEWRLFDETKVFPYSWAAIDKNLLPVTFGYIDTKTKLMFENLVDANFIPKKKLRQLVLSTQTILVHLLKCKDFLFTKYINNTLMEFLRRRVIQLIIGDKLYQEYIKNPKQLYQLKQANDFALELLKRKFPQLKVDNSQKLLALEIIAGVWWPQFRGISSFREDESLALFEFDSLDKAFEVNDFPQLEKDILRDISQLGQANVEFILDDVGEGVFDLFMIQHLLERFPKLKINIWVNRYPVDNNFFYPELIRILKDPYFKKLNEFQNRGRLNMKITNSPFLSPDVRFINEKTLNSLQKATAVINKGANFIETVQIRAANMYYAYNPHSPTTALLTGWPRGSGAVFVNVPKGHLAFEYIAETNSFKTTKDLYKEWHGRT